MAGPWEKYQQQPGQSISATPLPRNPEVVRSEQRDDAREDRKDNYDREDRSFDEAEKLRKEYQAQAGVVEYKVALGTLNSAKNTKPSAQGDQSLITSYAKMLDPNSVVREGEFAVTASTESMISQIKARMAKEFGWSEGGMLTPAGRKAVLGEMRNLVTNRFQPAYERDRIQYQRFADSYGVDPYKVVGEDAASTFPKDLLDPVDAPQSNTSLAGAGATEKGTVVPQEYQQAHYDYLKANWGKIDAQDYAAFRSRLDERFGLNPNPDAYIGAVAGFNEMATLGGTPGQLGAVPNPTEEMGAIEQGLNSAASSPEGAFAANWGNAGLAGLPARLSGNQDKLEAIRDMHPGASTGGEIVGGVTGALTMGAGAGQLASALQGGKTASWMANPMASDLVYSTIYGATQDDDMVKGAGTGLVSAIGGNVVGRQLGKAFPRVFAPDAVRAADNSVPSIPDLKMKAGEQYRAAEAAGEVAGPDATQGLLESSNAILSSQGRMTPAGRLIDADTPVTRSHMLMQDFAGQDMAPTQADSVRKVLGEGLLATRDGAPDNAQRQIAGRLIDNFDEWAKPVLPGIDDARETASRYLQGQEIAQAREMAGANSQWYTQSGEENALRSAFRGMDKATIRGTRSFDDNVEGAIQNVTRGTPFSNTMRGVGKLAPTGGIPIMSALAAGGLTAAGGAPVTGAITTGAVMGAGAIGRSIATAEARRAAEVAELLARGGPEYAEALEGAITLASRRGGNIATGLFAAPASSRYRSTTR